MEVDNPLSREFISHHPVEAARVLEQISRESASAFLAAIPEETAAPVIEAMLPILAAGCFSAMELSKAVKLFKEIPTNSAARIFRLINPEKQQQISSQLSAKQRNRIRRILSFASQSAGDLMNPNVDMLPDSLTVADTIRRMERYRKTVKNELFIVNSQHRFLGVVELGKLLTSKQNIKLRDIMSRKTFTLSVHASSDSLLNHPGWSVRQQLPVVDKDNVLVGILNYSRVKQITSDEAHKAQDPIENLLSLAALYWLSLMQLLDGLLNIKVANKRRLP